MAVEDVEALLFLCADKALTPAVLTLNMSSYSLPATTVTATVVVVEAAGGVTFTAAAAAAAAAAADDDKDAAADGTLPEIEVASGESEACCQAAAGRRGSSAGESRLRLQDA